MTMGQTTDGLIIIIIIKNECHSNIIVDRLQGCHTAVRDSENCLSTMKLSE